MESTKRRGILEPEKLVELMVKSVNKRDLVLSRQLIERELSKLQQPARKIRMLYEYAQVTIEKVGIARYKIIVMPVIDGVFPDCLEYTRRFDGSEIEDCLAQRELWLHLIDRSGEDLRGHFYVPHEEDGAEVSLNVDAFYAVRVIDYDDSSRRNHGNAVHART